MEGMNGLKGSRRGVHRVRVRMGLKPKGRLTADPSKAAVRDIRVNAFKIGRR